MVCETVLDHDWSDEIIIGSEPHPVLGQIVRVKQICSHCNRERRGVRPGSDYPTVPAYAASADRAGLGLA